MKCRSNLSIVCFLLTMLLVGCGKEVKNDNGLAPSIDPLGPSEIEERLSKQKLTCPDNQNCPSYMAKIVVSHGPNLGFCTGFLVDEEIIATSTSCLPDHLRSSDLECEKDVFIFFHKPGSNKPERYNCKEILQVSDLNGKDPVLWPNDVSFLRIKKPHGMIMARTPLKYVRKGVPNNKEFKTWVIDQWDDFSAVIRQDDCISVHQSWFNPLANNQYSPNMIFADCAFKKGNTGAPIIDSDGKLRAMISLPVSQTLKESIMKLQLLNEPLKEIIHATNFACAPTIFDNNVEDENECSKILSTSKIDRLRSEMTASESIFEETRKTYEKDLFDKSLYFRFGVKLTSTGHIRNTEFAPGCFKPINGWLSSLNGHSDEYFENLTLPIRKFRRIMDGFGRTKVLTEDLPAKKFSIYMSLKSVRRNKKSNITMYDLASGKGFLFPNLSETCPPSLL